MNALVCHEGFDNDARHGLGGMLAPESDLRGALQPLMREVVALGCDEEIEEEPYFVEDWEDGGAMAMQQRLLRPSPHGQRQQQRAAPMAMAEPSAIHAACLPLHHGHGHGRQTNPAGLKVNTMVRPPMGPNITSAPLPLPPPPRALGRSQSLLPAYHTSVNYNGHGSGNGPQQAAAPPPPPPAELPQQVMERLPPPGLLLRQRSFSCLSRPFRHSTGRFLSENLARVEAAPHEDVAERVSTMHAQERDVYAPPRAYFKRLEMDPLLAQWRRGAVRWFSKVVEHLHANREAIATATNFLDRHFGAVLYPATTATAARTVGAGYPSSWVTEQEQGQGMEEDGVDGDDNPFRPPPLLLDADQEAFERAAVSALALALKMHQGDSTASLAPRLAALSSLSAQLTPRALCELEFEMVGALGRYLNPPTPGTMIHHLLHFLPRDAVTGNNHNNCQPLLLALDDHANDLALMALETPALAAFPASVVAVAAILASFARIRADGANKWLDPALELRWLEALDRHHLNVEPEEITACLEQLGRQAKKASAPSSCPSSPTAASAASLSRSNASGGGSVGVGSPLSEVEGLFLPHYLNPPRTQQQQQAAVPGTPCLNWGGKMARVLSPTGVDEIDAMVLGGGCGAKVEKGDCGDVIESLGFSA